MNTIYRLISATFCSFSFAVLWSQAPDIEWQKCIGGTTTDLARSIVQASDGGYFVAGNSYSNDGDVIGNHGGDDFLILKTGPLGTIQWQKCLGGSEEEQVYTIAKTFDGGCAAAGYTLSNDGDITQSFGNRDLWIVKLDAFGNLDWERSYGGLNIDQAHSMQQTSDGGYIVAGFTNSIDGDISVNDGLTDFWVLKLDVAGNIEWERTYGGTGIDIANSIESTSDGGYVVCGYTESSNGDVSGFNGGFQDGWIVKIDAIGNLLWQNSIGGTSWDMFESINETQDGSFIAVGGTESNDGDVSGNNGNYDFWIIKINSSGNLEWQQCYGGTGPDIAMSVAVNSVGNYIVSGFTGSFGSDVSGNHGQDDFWIISIDELGTLQWQKCLGGSLSDSGEEVIVTADDSYVVTGSTQSNNGNVSGNHGGQDFWVVKLLPDCIPTVGFESIVSCTPVNINSEDFLTSGTYIQTLVNAAGCDSTVTINFTLDPFATYGALEVLVLADGLPVENMAVEVSSVQSGQYPAQELVTDVNGIALFENLPYGDYVCLTNPNPAIPGQELMLPTFSNETTVWYEAEHLDIGCGLTKPTNIDNVILPPRPIGPGSVSGQVFGGGVNRTGDPIPGIPIKISTDTISENAYPPPGDGIYVLFDYAVTDENGHYEFPELPYGHFKVDVIVPGLYTLPDPSQTAISDSTAHFFTVQLGSIEYTENSFWVDPELGVFLDPDAPDCSGDINQDGITGFADLVVLLADYGCNSGDCTADLNDDGLVNFNDLTIMLGNYGTECP